MPMDASGQERISRLQAENKTLRNALSLLKKTNTELKNSEAQFRALVESSIDHVFMLDANGTYLFSNDRVLQFGLGRGNQLVGRKLQDVYPSDIQYLYLGKLQEVIQHQQVVTFAHEQTSADRGTQHYQSTLYPILRKGHFWAVGGICHDISEQKKIEKQLYQAQKMDSLGTLVAGVAHEINNPINLMLFNLPLFAKMWQDLVPVLDVLPGEVQSKKFGGLTYPFIKQNMLRLISDMEMSASRVARIVSGLKQFSRKSNPAEKTDVHVNTAVENAVRLAKSTFAKSKTELELSLAPDLPLLHANLQNLEQIVLNLMINAFQSIAHDHGRVRIATGWHKEEQSIYIEVADNGRGVSLSVAEKIFDPFVTDRQADGGTGLGLSVTYNLVKAHNGDVYFKPGAHEGTEFTILLPTGGKRRLHKIMVVDDDANLRAAILHMLSKRTGASVEGFANGAEALIRLGSYPPDLLILDMFMPQIDGLGVCQGIKNELGLEKTKVIIVTGFPEHPNVAAAKRLGFKQVMPKPIHTERFLELVAKNLYGNSAR